MCIISSSPSPVFRPYFLSPISCRAEGCPQIKIFKWLEIPLETTLILKLHEIIVPVLCFSANTGCYFFDTQEAIHNIH